MEGEKISLLIGINDFLVGGAQKQITEQLRYFDRSRFKISVVTLFQFPKKKDLYHLLPLDVDIIKLSFRKCADFPEWIKLFQILRRIKPDIVLSNLFFSNLVFRVLSWFFTYKVIIVEHNTYTGKRKWEIFVDRFLAYFTSRIIAVSKTVADFTVQQEKIPRKKFIVIQNGIDIFEIEKKLRVVDRKKLRKQFYFSPETRVAINVSRLTDQKNHRLLIEVFSDFVQINPNNVLLILGEGSLMKDLTELITEKRMEKNIFLLGSREDVVSFYKLSDYFISVSKIEGLSIAYLEALASGLPLLATKTAGTDEMLEDGKNGFFVECTHASILKGLQKINNSNLIHLGECAHASVRAFDIRKNVVQYELLLAQCLEKNKKTKKKT